MNFKVVSTGQRVGNLTADPMLIVNPKTNRFRLTPNAAKLIGAESGESVTVLADTEAGLFAIHKAVKRLNKDGEEMMKDVKMTDERKNELKKAGEKIPQEPVYVNGCKLGSHLEFGSSNAIAQTGLELNTSCELDETVSGEDIGNPDIDVVAIFNYKDGETDATDEEPVEAED